MRAEPPESPHMQILRFFGSSGFFDAFQERQQEYETNDREYGKQISIGA